MKEYILGSFNMYKFSRQSGSETKKSYETIARIIHEAKFDIVAMQEVFSKAAVAELVYVLNGKSRTGDWDFSWDEPKKTKNKQAREGYAFVWNTKRLDKVRTHLDNGDIRVFEPRIVNQYRKDIIKTGRKELIRNPYYGRFAPKKEGHSFGFELRIINAHIMYSKSGEDEYDLSSIDMRKNEYALLSQVVLPKIDLKIYGLEEEDNNGVKSHLNAYTVLMGDYNLNIKNSQYGNPGPYLPESSYLSKGFIIYLPKESEVITVQDEKTTFKRKLQDLTEDKYKNNYDHFTFDKVKFDKYNVGWDAHRINVVENNPIGINIPVSKEFEGDFMKYIDKVSDHLPVMMKLQIPN